MLKLREDPVVIRGIVPPIEGELVVTGIAAEGPGQVENIDT